MRLAEWFGLFIVLSVIAIGCGGGGDNDPSDACNDAFDRFEECNADVPEGRQKELCDVDVKAVEGDDDCDDTLIAYFECLEDLTCSNIRDGDEGECPDEFLAITVDCDENPL